jgi:hypothetical protein
VKLLIVLTFALAACGGGKGKPTTPTTGSAAPDKMQGSAATKPDAKPDGTPDKDPCAIPPD